jgi:hypothetical protein
MSAFVREEFWAATARWLAPALPESAEAVIIPHDEAVFLSASEGKAGGPVRERQDFR